MNAHPEKTAYLQRVLGDAPPFFTPYLQAPEMRRLQQVGLLCGTDYSRLYRPKFFYSRLDHSLAAAAMVWRFTGGASQALSALFHDIATPVFSHSVDFMLGDALTQTRTEAKTESLLRQSRHIRRLLDRSGIPLSAVSDYHQYPVADNDSPRLSADRLEYTLSTALCWQAESTAASVLSLYEDITPATNEDGAAELSFQHLEAAEAFVSISLRVFRRFQQNENKLSLSYLGDLLQASVRLGLVTEDELYTLTEPEIIGRFTTAESPSLREAWQAYTQLAVVHGSDTPPASGYTVRVDAKRRYIHPLVVTQKGVRRAADLSRAVRQQLDAYLAYRDKPYGYIDFAPVYG